MRQADPALRSLVLTGGFARGEGMVLDGVPQNDYDFVALRGVGRPSESYAAVRRRLEAKLGLHIDLAPVPAWRLRWAPASVFWYETALRGRVLWGPDLRSLIPVRQACDLDRNEGMRLLVNRGAGLLLVTESRDDDAVRIQAAKAILAVLDAHLLAAGHFAPTQLERWRKFQHLLATGRAPLALQEEAPLLAWAIRYKTEPSTVAERDPHVLWCAARRLILETLPTALRHAGFDLSGYGRSDGLLDRVVYGLRVHRAPGARRFLLHPTGQVRLATLRLLAASRDRRVDAAQAQECFAGIARMGESPLRMLEALRGATLQ